MSAPFPHRARGRLDGGDDADVAGAPADAARELLADLVLARARVALQQVERGEQEARCAEPALQAVLVLERALHGVELVARREALDRLDAGALDLDREHRARADELAVDPDRAGAAHALLAADVRARQAELV